jgi:chaperonin cofactor prefoldin
MNQNFYLEELTKKVDSLEKRLAVLEKLLSGDNK